MSEEIENIEGHEACVNCNEVVQGNYCSNCGQRNNMPRYSLRLILDNFFSSIFSFERGFWLTLKTLIVNPKEVLDAYLSGNTVKYFHPMRLFIFTSFINTFIILQFGLFDESIEGLQGLDYAGQSSELQLKIQENIKKFMNVLNLINIPFYALSSFLLYRKKGYNYAEHTIINTYVLAVYVGISILFSIALAITPDIGVYFTSVLILLSFLVYVHVFRLFFEDSWIKTIGKTLLLTLLSLFFIFISVTIIMFLVALVLGPEFVLGKS